ncbi:MAG: hypothetical protein ACXVBF_01355 [Flavisolibacter sp.]
MEENQNTNEQPQDIPLSEVNETSESIPSSAATITLETTEETPTAANQPQTKNHQTQTDPMEVHKHPHHVMHKKKWTEYLLEFFMLFLAVFLGFIAENIRENQVEKEKAKQYLLSFYEDLKNDTSRINALIAYDKQKIDALATMYNCYDTISANLLSTDCMGQLVKYSRSNKGFVLTQRTLQQLANAGGYRLLNKENADSIAAYENAYKAYLDFQSTVFQTAQDNVRNTLNRLADFRVIAPLQLTTASFSGDTFDVKPKGPLLITKDRLLINQWFNELSLYLRTINGQMTIMLQLKTRATGLLKFYNNRYQFER